MVATTPTTPAPRKRAEVRAAEEVAPVARCDALGRTATETCRQHERRSRLVDLGVTPLELASSQALVDTCDLALAECVREVEKVLAKSSVSDDADVKQAANKLFLSARDYLRRHSIAEKASRQLQHHDVEKLGDLHSEYELEGLRDAGTQASGDGLWQVEIGREVADT